MTSYRVARRKYADLRGEGARLYGGRCNPPGIAAIYSSENIALAVLEGLVHVDKSEVPSDYVVIAIRFAGRRVTRGRRAYPGQDRSPQAAFVHYISTSRYSVSLP